MRSCPWDSIGKTSGSSSEATQPARTFESRIILAFFPVPPSPLPAHHFSALTGNEGFQAASSAGKSVEYIIDCDCPSLCRKREGLGRAKVPRVEPATPWKSERLEETRTVSTLLRPGILPGSN